MPRLLVAAGAGLSACVAVWTLLAAPARVGAHLAAYGVAFAAYLVALHAARDVSARALGLALAAAVVWRVALVAAPPLLSDDVNRSVWEGRVQVHGGNPYAWSDRPEAPRWESLRDTVWQGLNHRDYPAVYPPLWELAVWGVASVHDSVTAVKAFVVLCEVLTIVALVPLLRRRGLPLRRLLIFAWSPLALVEIAGGGHNEALGLLLLVVSLWALETGRPLLSAVAAGLGFQAKFLPGLVAAAWARRYRSGHVVVAALVAGALVLPYARAGSVLWLSLGKYATFWRFNETLFAPLAWALGHRPAVVAAAGLALALALVLAWRRTEPVAAATIVLAAVLVLSPNVLPWYALWLLPLLTLRDEPAALLFTGTVGLAYLVYPAWQSGERWYFGWAWRVLEYGPCLAVGLWSRRRT